MAKQTLTLLRKVKHEVPGDYYHIECPACGADNVVLVINKGHVAVRSEVFSCEMANSGLNEREARLPKGVLDEIEAVVAAKPKEEPTPVPEPVIPGEPGGPNLVIGPNEDAAPVGS